MPIIDTVVRTIKCDAPACTKNIVFDRKDEKATFEVPENSWMRGLRVVQTADGRNNVYCSDSCEVEGAKTGRHNLPEPKTIVEGNAQAIAIAAKAAEAARAADGAIRTGQPAQIQIAEK